MVPLPLKSQSVHQTRGDSPQLRSSPASRAAPSSAGRSRLRVLLTKTVSSPWHRMLSCGRSVPIALIQLAGQTKTLLFSISQPSTRFSIAGFVLRRLGFSAVKAMVSHPYCVVSKWCMPVHGRTLRTTRGTYRLRTSRACIHDGNVRTREARSALHHGVCGWVPARQCIRIPGRDVAFRSSGADMVNHRDRSLEALCELAGLKSEEPAIRQSMSWG